MPYPDHEPIDYVLARRESGAKGRIVKSFSVIALLLLAMGIYRGSIPATHEMPDPFSFAAFWFLLAFGFGAVALLVGYVSWIRTGRVW